MLIETSERQLESVAKERLLLRNSNHPQDDRNMRKRLRSYLFPFGRANRFHFIFQPIKPFKERIPKRYTFTFSKRKRQSV